MPGNKAGSAPGAGKGATPRARAAALNKSKQKSIRVIEANSSAPVRLKRVAAYARVSMESEALINSFSAQVSYYSDLIRRTPGWRYAGIFADEGISGTSTKRPGFQRTLSECEAGNIDLILTKSISRFARNTVDLLETIRHLKELEIEVQFEKERIRSLSEDGELMLTLMASFAQEESYSISENCKWSIRKRYESGKPRNRGLYGYRVVNGNLAIVEEEAEVVRRIFRMFLEGESCYAIGKKLTLEGIRSYSGTGFSGVVVSYMLRQEKYTGCTLCQKFYTENHITHREIRNRGELPMYFIEGTHPAIISRETFQAAQEEFVRRHGVDIRNGIAGRAPRK